MANGVAGLASVQRVQSAKGIRWRAQIRRKGYEQQSAYFDRKSDAEAWARQIEAGIDAGKNPIGSEAKKHTLADVIDRYVLEVLPGKKSAKDQNQQLGVWKTLLGDLKLAEITTDRLLKARTSISEHRGRHGGKVTNATVNRYWAALHHVLETTVREYGWLEQNPMKRIKKLKEPQGRVRYLDAAEREALLNACAESENPFLETIVLIALTTGLRRQEILGLDWSRVNFETGQVIVEETKNGMRRSTHFLDPILTRLKHLFEQNGERSNFLFPGRTGLRPIDIKSAWYRAVAKAGLEDFRFHDLRHTAASYIAMDGGSVPEIAAVLGHKSFQMASRYAHLSDDHTKSILEKTMKGVLGDE
ncbi:site-specific integrase [Leisingera sp. F5]|uniref:tyrosine-type recombinase/integrase n=1 Tax=Leisingera sp. F5 TaxID=1813816 RepID=UPI000A655AA2|nr:site-specific integrase [Leisingera sp. F5]